VAASSEGGAARVAVFGGSFNPPHVGHVLGAVYALSTAPIDEILVVPVYRHPFAKELAPYADRLAMCRLALGWLPRVSVSTVEEELGGESLTLRTVERLAAAHPSWSLRLLIGADVLGDLPKWHRWDRIAEIAPPLVMGRSGVAVHDAGVPWVGAEGEEAPPGHDGGHPRAPEPVLPCVSSTEIRAALATRGVGAVRGLVPARVLDHIAENGLYGVRRVP
jgi:nicotinate-nucleotide adenylyltransferase